MASEQFRCYDGSVMNSQKSNPISAIRDHITSLSHLLQQQSISDILQHISSFLYTIWLFTYSDLKTIVGPQSAFGTLTALAAIVFEQPSSPSIGTWSILQRLPVTIVWVYLNLLPFTLANQRHPSAIAEDAINKPWRPLPSGRINSTQAHRLMLVLYVNALMTSAYLGGLKQCAILIVLGYCYNDAGGSDRSCIIRNLINASGFASFASGAMEVALGQRLLWTPRLLQWFAIIALVVFTTVQTQDLYDMEGDQLKGRRTIPLVIGDKWARWSIAIPVTCFTIICPWFWDISLSLSSATIILGCTIAGRTLTYRNVEADKTTFRVWNLWLVSLYCLPAIKHVTG